MLTWGPLEHMTLNIVVFKLCSIVDNRVHLDMFNSSDFIVSEYSEKRAIACDYEFEIFGSSNAHV